MSLIIPLLKKHKTEKAAGLIELDPKLLDETDRKGNNLAHWSVMLGNGEMLSFLVNFINEYYVNDEIGRLRKLSRIFESLNDQQQRPTDIAIKKCHYNFLVFLIEHCCPNGFDMFLPVEDYLKYYRNIGHSCMKCFDFYLKNCPERSFTGYKWWNSEKRRYLQKSREKYYPYFSAIFNNLKDIFRDRAPTLGLDRKNQKEINSFIDEYPRLAWSNFIIPESKCDDLAMFAANLGCLDILKHIYEVIITHHCSTKTKYALLFSTFQTAPNPAHHGANYWNIIIVNSPIERSIMFAHINCLKFIVEFCCPEGILFPKHIVYESVYGINYNLLHIAAISDAEKFDYLLLNMKEDPREYLSEEANFECYIPYGKYHVGYESGNDYYLFVGTPLEIAKKYKRTDIVEYLENFNFEDLQRRRERYLVEKSLEALQTEEATLPALMLEVMGNEMDASDYRRRQRMRYLEDEI